MTTTGAPPGMLKNDSRDLSEVLADGLCRKCRGPMAPGKAIEQTYTSASDFLGTPHVCTVSSGGSGKLVVCAAIRAADGRLVLGIRHYSADMHAQIARRDDRNRFQHLMDENQGFVDQHGVYMTREEAYRVADTAGQIIRPHACGNGIDGPKLYSEGLY